MKSFIDDIREPSLYMYICGSNSCTSGRSKSNEKIGVLCLSHPLIVCFLLVCVANSARQPINMCCRMKSFSQLYINDVQVQCLEQYLTLMNIISNSMTVHG